MTAGKTVALTMWTFVSKVMSLPFYTPSRFVIAFLPKSSCLLVSWLQSPSALILEPKKRKTITASTFSPFTCHEVMGLDAVILVFIIFGFKCEAGGPVCLIAQQPCMASLNGSAELGKVMTLGMSSDEEESAGL